MASETDIFITIPQGILKGKVEKSYYGITYYGFQGIPYAKPPVGDLRFKAPQPADGWNGVRDATKSGPTCPGLESFLGTPKIQQSSNEDCLFINVFTRELPETGRKWPVMAHIHGGGYALGSGNKSFCSPDHLIAHDVVYVSFNYRLGALGFLSLQTSECPGNYGLKDQRLALQWVKNNISYFGGDPDNVTIFGISAGGASVHNLTISPSCKGLFQKAIAQSGSSVNAWGYILHPRESAYLLGKRLGCDAKNDEELLSFLQEAGVEEIVLKSVGIWTEIEGERIGEKILNVAFCPTSEPESEEAILPNEPLTKGNQLDIPYITGVNNREMLMEVSYKKDFPNWKDDEDFQELIPRELGVKKDSELSLKIAKKIKEFFFTNNKEKIEALVDALSDIYFNHGVYRAIKHRVTNKKINSPTFAYIFSYEGETNSWDYTAVNMFGYTEPPDVKGVSHGGDMYYFFVTETPSVTTALKADSLDYKISQRLVKMWVNFATTGSPTNDNSEINWAPTTTENNVYLHIDKEFEIKEGFFKDRMEFWDEIYKMAGRDPY